MDAYPTKTYIIVVSKYVSQPFLSVVCVQRYRNSIGERMSRPRWQIGTVQATELKKTLAKQIASTHKSEIHLCGETATVIPLLGIQVFQPLARRCSRVGEDSWVPLFECDTELVN